MIRVLNSVATFSGVSMQKEWKNTNARNFLAAAKRRHADQEAISAANGNASGCRTWVEVDGKGIDSGMLPDTLAEAQAELERMAK